MKEVIYNGTKKAFLESHTLQERQFDTLYTICRGKTKTTYWFKNGLENKNFTLYKKITVVKHNKLKIVIRSTPVTKEGWDDLRGRINGK